MIPPPQVVQWIKFTYPKPAVDPEWLNACYTWIIEECGINPLTDLQKIKQNVESQLLQSDLRDSMVPGTGLPPNVSELTTNITLPGPILVEITAITEIGHSAFTLQNTRQARIDRTDLSGLAAQEAEEDDGPIPKYPRSMLRFELSDGETTLQAMEYRSLPEIQLGVTPLGYKMVLKNVVIRRGLAFLEPKCVVMKGHLTDDREAMQDADFARGLRMRLGQPEPDPDDEPPAPAVPPPGPPDLPPAAPPAAPRSPPPVGYSLTNREDESLSLVQPQPPISSSNNPTLAQSSYFSDETYTTHSGPSAVLARERLLSPIRHSEVISMSNDDTATAHADKGKERAKGTMSPSSSEYGGDTMDDDFREQLDQAEMKAMEAFSTSSSRPVMPSAIGTQGRASLEVITIEDDKDDDKENMNFPVTTRHVRRRTVVLQSDVIDLSD